LRDGLEQLAKENGLAEYFVLEGSSVLFNFVTRDESKTQSMKYRALFSQEMIRNGVLMPWVGVSQAHTDTELGITLDAASKALRVYAAALNDGVEKYLVGSELKPVFRKFN
jgi:glutamate-1-semialdehyde 2,1-aminomutase